MARELYLAIEITAMNKSIIIIVSVVWVLCSIYIVLAKSYSMPHGEYAMVGSWVAALLLLLCIIVYIKKHKRGN